MFEPGETRSLEELGLTGRRFDRRTLLKAGVGTAAAVGLAGTVGAPAARAGLNRLARADAHPVGHVVPGTTQNGQITGPTLTNQFDAPYTDLCIPVLTRRGMLYIGGDTYSEPAPANPANRWRAPIGLRSSKTALDDVGLTINGAVTDGSGRAKDLVGEPHGGNPPTTALPSDVFNLNGRLFMHLMRGPIYDTHHTDFWYSDDDGDTWKFIRQWPREMYGYQFQQKTYAAGTQASDPYVYVVSTIFNRDIMSGMLLFRVLKNDLIKAEDPAVGPIFAYQGWGFANGRWAWGNQPTSITETRYWGEICFRAMDGMYALSWFQPNRDNHAVDDIRAMVYPLPTTNLVTTTEQTMVYASPAPGRPAESVRPNLYGGFIIPGSTFDNFHFIVSNWNGSNKPQDFHSGGNNSNYICSQWRTTLNRNLHG